MFKRREMVVKRLFEDLPKMELVNYEDREARELFLDQLGNSVSSGGRGCLFCYLCGIVLLPFGVRTMPSSLIRIPMTVGFFAFYEEIYYFGARVMLMRTSKNIISQMNSLSEESKLRGYAKTLVAS
jgi:hypothetical protein